MELAKLKEFETWFLAQWIVENVVRIKIQWFYMSNSGLVLKSTEYVWQSCIKHFFKFEYENGKKNIA